MSRLKVDLVEAENKEDSRKRERRACTARYFPRCVSIGARFIIILFGSALGRATSLLFSLPLLQQQQQPRRQQLPMRPRFPSSRGLVRAMLNLSFPSTVPGYKFPHYIYPSLFFTLPDFSPLIRSCVSSLAFLFFLDFLAHFLCAPA